MEISVLKDEKEYAEIMFKEADVGFTNLIVEKLVQSKGVTFAASAYEHPLRGNPIVKIKAKDPYKELKKAAGEVKDEIEDFEKTLKKELE